MVNRDKVRDKIQIIKNNIRRLEAISENSLEEFLQNPLMPDASIRILQVSIEAMLDISHHIVSRRHLGTPKSYRETIELLGQHGIINKKQLPTFVNMIKFRNRAVHLYDEIADEEIYEIIQNHLTDFEDFIASVVHCCMNNH
ncbi:MAG: DUF86 domain-containing protein [Bacillota bacterium]|nr:DUF86 domain-containing protein [Bacillota bacterium]